jgi:hypothetical protein
MANSTPEHTLLVAANSEILSHPATQTLHIYENGEVLVRTTATVDEATHDSLTPITTGVCLPEDGDLKRSETSRHPLHELPDDETINAYIELIGPVDQTWLEVLNQLAIELLQFRPEHSFLSRATVQAFRQALQQSFVLDVLPIEGGNKPQPNAPETGAQEVWIVVQSPAHQIATIIQELAALPEVQIDPNQEVDVVGFYLRLRATVSAQGQAALLHHPKVLAVEPYSPVQPEDEVAGLILAGQYDSAGRPQGSYLRWLEDHGLNGDGVTIGIVDAGVNTAHPGFAGRIKDLNPDRKSWHGTFVAGHAAGCYLQEKDGNQFIYGLGMAPKAELLIQDNQSIPTALCRETVTEKGPSGRAGMVQNNSWGAGTKNPMDYGSQEATYDRLVRNADPDSPVAKPLTICFSAGNSGANGLTRPKAAKNIIVTGNSENYRPDIGKDQSDNISEVYTGPRGSSHGNCGDGRIVPHLVAPGEWTASANYDSHPGEKEYISPHLTWGSGTSAASPKTAGACALLIQWWRQRNHNQDPSPALLKAILVNGAEPLPGMGFIPNTLQGWGRLNLETVLRRDIQRTYVDQTLRLKQRSDQQTWTVRVVNPSLPVKITLCWTDPPGSLGTGTATASAIVNKLALRVTLNGQVYRANQFQTGWSYSSADSQREGWDNLQNIFLAPGVASGTLQVSVLALEITTNCLTGKIDTPQQDFALVISNGMVEGGSRAIFVGVDPKAQAQPPAQPNPTQPSSQYWGNENRDRQDLDAAWWQTIDRASGKPAAPKSPQPPTPAQVEAWWLQEDVIWSKPEGDRDRPMDLAIAQSLEAGMTVVTAGQAHQIVMANPRRAETDRAGETQDLIVISGDRADAVAAETTRETRSVLPLTMPLTESLDALMRSWNQFGATLKGATAERVAVLLLGAGTQVTPSDLAALRRLTLLGTLYLVADDAPLLSFLVQRIHQQANLICRLAKDATGLPALLRDTLVEASGGQQLAIAKTSQILDGRCVSTCSFDVTSCDRHLTIRIQFPPQQAPQVEWYRPSLGAMPLTATPETAGIAIRMGEDFLQVDGPLDLATAGGWKLRLRQVGPVDVCRVRVWAWSDLSIAVGQTLLPDTANAEGQPLKLLLRVSGRDGTILSRIQGQPRWMVEPAELGPVAAESDREIEVTASEPRSGAQRPRNESSRAIQAPELSTLLEIAPPTAGAIAVDLPLWVEGMDAKGYEFTRLIRPSLIQLEPRSHWRQRLQDEDAASSLPLLTPATLLDLLWEGGEVVGLRVQRGDRQRSVWVTSPVLKRQLAWLQSTLLKQNWQVAVLGQELYGLYRCLK